MPRQHYAGVIWKRMFYFENASNVFLSHYARETVTRNNHWSLWICGWLMQGKRVIIAILAFSKSIVFKIFPSTLKGKVGVFTFLPCLKSDLIRRASFSKRISVDSRPNGTNRATFLNSSDVVYTLELIVDC